jgi:hypothetical protein
LLIATFGAANRKLGPKKKKKHRINHCVKLLYLIRKAYQSYLKHIYHSSCIRKNNFFFLGFIAMCTFAMEPKLEILIDFLPIRVKDLSPFAEISISAPK